MVDTSASKMAKSKLLWLLVFLILFKKGESSRIFITNSNSSEEKFVETSLYPGLMKIQNQNLTLVKLHVNFSDQPLQQNIDKLLIFQNNDDKIQAHLSPKDLINMELKSNEGMYVTIKKIQVANMKIANSSDNMATDQHYFRSGTNPNFEVGLIFRKKGSVKIEVNVNSSPTNKMKLEKEKFVGERETMMLRNPTNLKAMPIFSTFFTNRKYELSISIPKTQVKVTNELASKSSSIVLRTRENLKNVDDEIMDKVPKFFETTIQSEDFHPNNRISARIFKNGLLRIKRSEPTLEKNKPMFKPVPIKSLKNGTNFMKPTNRNFPSFFQIGAKLQTGGQSEKESQSSISNEKLQTISKTSQGVNRFSNNSMREGSSGELLIVNNSNFLWGLDTKDKRFKINHTYETGAKGTFANNSHSFQTLANFLLPKNISLEHNSNRSGNGFYDDQENYTKEDVKISTFQRKNELINKFIKRHPAERWKSFGFYEDSYLEVVDSHWLQFEAAGPWVHRLYAFAYFFIMIIGCGGNLIVITMFARCQSLRTPSNYLIINMAVSDFLHLATIPIFIINSLYEGPVFGALGCKIYGFVGGLTGTASIMTLTAIALERYFVIVYPLNHKITTSSRALFFISFVWSYSFTFASLPLLGLNTYVSEGYLTSCGLDYLSDKLNDRIFVFVFFIAAWLLPLTIIVVCYKIIYQNVKQAERNFFHSTSNKNIHTESFRIKSSEKKTDEKIAVLSCQLIIIWTCAWMPYAVVGLFGIFGYREMLTPLVSALPALFCKIASCIDPFLYAIKQPSFNEEFKNMFGFNPTDWLMRRQSRGFSLVANYSTIEDLVSDLNIQSYCQPVGRNNASCEFSPSRKIISQNLATMSESKRLIQTRVEVTKDSVIEKDEEELRIKSLENNICVGGNQPFGHNFAKDWLFIDDIENSENPGLDNYKIVETHKTKRIYSDLARKSKVNLEGGIIAAAAITSSGSDSFSNSDIFGSGRGSLLESCTDSGSRADGNADKNRKLISILVKPENSSHRNLNFKRKSPKNLRFSNNQEKEEEHSNSNSSEGDKVEVKVEKAKVERVKLETLIM